MDEWVRIVLAIIRLAMLGNSIRKRFSPILNSLATALFGVSFTWILACSAGAQEWLAVPIVSAIKNPSAKVAQAQKLLRSQRYDQAVGVLRGAVESDRDPDAQYLLGWCYANGNGVSRSLLQAEQSFFGAAQRKHVAALYSLGRLRVDTAQPGNTKRVASGLDSLKGAAAQGMGAAMRRLGIIYKVGLPGSLAPDSEVAKRFRWIRLPHQQA